MNIINIDTISKEVKPKDLLTYSGELLASYARLFVYDDAYIDKTFLVDYNDLEQETLVVEEEEERKITPIDVLMLSERTRNALIKNNILYVEDLEKKTKNELLSMKGVWKKAVDEIIDALKGIWKELAG